MISLKKLKRRFQKISQIRQSDKYYLFHLLSLGRIEYSKGTLHKLLTVTVYFSIRQSGRFLYLDMLDVWLAFDLVDVMLAYRRIVSQK